MKNMRRDQIEAMLDRMVQAAGENDAQVSALAEFVSVIHDLAEETHEEESRKIYDLFLSNASVISEKVIQDNPIGNDILSMNRLFGKTWLKADSTYSTAYLSWDKFQGLVTQSIQGMTTNERLFVLGLLDPFDSASAKKSRSEMESILSKCFLTPENVKSIIENELKK
jgi:hypothetical protein